MDLKKVKVGDKLAVLKGKYAGLAATFKGAYTYDDGSVEILVDITDSIYPRVEDVRLHPKDVMLLSVLFW